MLCHRVDRGFNIIRSWSLSPRLPIVEQHGQEQVFVVKFTYEPLNNGMYTGHGLVLLSCRRQRDKSAGRGLTPPSLSVPLPQKERQEDGRVHRERESERERNKMVEGVR